MIIELDKLSSDESESKKDSMPDFQEGRLSQFCADYRRFQLHCCYSASGKLHLCVLFPLFIYLYYESSIGMMRNIGDFAAICR